MTADQNLDATETASSSSRGAARMRTYRRRRRRGTRCVRVAVSPTDIDGLIAKGYLGPDEREDRQAIGAGASWFLSDALAREA
jgi:hypothetical protein